MKYRSISFIIPVYNEEATLKLLLDKLIQLDLGIKKEYVVVDDASKDATPKILREYEKYDLKVITFSKNRGKSQAVKSGILASSGDLVVIQDADLEYDPNDLNKFVEIMQTGEVDIVYGNRFSMNNEVIYWLNWWGNTLLSFISRIFTNIHSPSWNGPRDMEVCYKMAVGDVFRDIAQGLTSTSRFGLEPEITAKFARYRLNGKNLRFRQIPIHYYPRTKKEGKKINVVRDGVRALWEIIKYNT